MSKKIILDVDTGTDDAVAIMIAALRPQFDVVACTTVWGNLPVANTTDNTLRVLQHIGRNDVPVYRGLDSPFGPMPTTDGGDDDQSGGRMHPPVLDLPPSESVAEATPAVEWLVATLRAATEPITLVPVGPLTNIAAAITLDPSIVEKVDEVVIMGGAHNFGNVTPSAEANIWHDPIAADVVFRAGFKRIVLIPLDATHDALITLDQAHELRALDTPAGRAAADCIQQRIEAHDASQPQPIPHSAAVHDALCIAYLIDPRVVPLTHLHVAVETSGPLTVGRTVMDIRGRGRQEPNTHVALSADRQLFFEIMRDTLAATS
ncbi:nucleoside hydrolase [Microbacterium esteraromaticum]|uniref:nucleoside hydrolase n=1 Tax=Microbacterium esteraromaticum TaxID=57043 RepID=UPI001C98D585|nr:nucleoside hydrolase [Microbacterium esteraromaticum]MBY6062214.1 nucleoside hydrolase [Microbacterium esteraromaticum]